MALEVFPPALLMGTRYTLSGGILLAAAWLRGAYLPRGRELAEIAATGLATIGAGTGMLVYAETWIPSGLAAVFIAMSPFWMTGIEALWPGGARLRGPVLAGLGVGMAGTILLVSQSASSGAHPREVITGFLLLQIGCAGWALGSIARRRVETKAHPVVTGAVQQFATGVVYLVPALLFGGHHIHPEFRGFAATAYLVLVGSVAGYSAYAYALDRLPVSLVSMYTYVNPVIAVFLGWLIYSEPFGWRETVAVLVIFLGVAMVKRHEGRPAMPPVTVAAGARQTTA